MDHFTVKNTKFVFTTCGTRQDPQIIWGHGWGHSHRAMMPLAEALDGFAAHTLIDFPGFGASSDPAEIWGTQDYADAIAEWIRTQNMPPIIWVGHSFGGRVGIQLAARHPDLISGLFLVAAAGLKRKRPFHKELYLKSRILLFKALKKLIPVGLSENWLKSKFGSGDYKQLSGTRRNVFVNVVNEDLSPQAAQIKCPVTLVYGENDTETPPEIGQRLEKLIPKAKMVLLEGQDHYSVLQDGRHQVINLLSKFIKTLS